MIVVQKRFIKQLNGQLINMLKNKKIGIGLTGSFCSLQKTLAVIKELAALECDLYIFASEKILNCNTRFNKADELIHELEKLSKRKVITNVNDNAVTMACKSTLRNEHNVVLAIATNDALSNSGKNIMQILNTKHFYLVPMYQDDCIKKPNSMLFDETLVIQTVINAINNNQLQPVFEGVKDD